MKAGSQIPRFASEAWYLDPRDSRCPRDACLESVDVCESEKVIKVTLLGASEDGWIVFTYSGVHTHNVACYLCDQGVGHWLRDEFSVVESGLIEHRITWQSPLGGTSQWRIETAEVTCEWLPW